MNTPESSPSGNVHGMPLAAILGYGVPELHDLFGYKPKIEPQNVVLVGVRRFGFHEKKFIQEAGRENLHQCATSTSAACAKVMADALKYAMDDTAGVCVSLDMDFLDPSDAPAWARPSAAVSPTAKRTSPWKLIADSEAMVAMEIVEINPNHRRAQPHRAPRRRTRPIRPRQENPVAFAKVPIPGTPISRLASNKNAIQENGAPSGKP